MVSSDFGTTAVNTGMPTRSSPVISASRVTPFAAAIALARARVCSAGTVRSENREAIFGAWCMRSSCGMFERRKVASSGSLLRLAAFPIKHDEHRRVFLRTGADKLHQTLGTHSRAESSSCCFCSGRALFQRVSLGWIQRFDKIGEFDFCVPQRLVSQSHSLQYSFICDNFRHTNTPFP